VDGSKVSLSAVPYSGHHRGSTLANEFVRLCNCAPYNHIELRLRWFVSFGALNRDAETTCGRDETRDGVSALSGPSYEASELRALRSACASSAPSASASAARLLGVLRIS
jgi:hypothetical protein